MTEYAAFQLPDGPSIPGLSFRYFSMDADFAAMVSVIEACQEFDHVDRLSSEAGIPTIEQLRDSFSQADNISLDADLLLVLMEQVVIGFQWVRWWTQADGTYVYYHRGRVIPAWRGHGIGTATMRWAERRIRELVERHGSAGRAVFQANTTSHEASYNELLVTEGYTPVHSFIEMGYSSDDPLPAVVLPEGFELRPARPEHYRAIWQANEAAFSDEWGRRPVDDEGYIKFVGHVLSNPGVDPALWQIAWHGDEVAGVALCELTKPGVGEITELSVQPQWRGRGLAKALIISAAQALTERGVRHVRIFTDADNLLGARSLYESIGFRVLTEYIRYQKPVLEDAL